MHPYCGMAWPCSRMGVFGWVGGIAARGAGRQAWENRKGLVGLVVGGGETLGEKVSSCVFYPSSLFGQSPHRRIGSTRGVDVVADGICRSTHEAYGFTFSHTSLTSSRA